MPAATKTLVAIDRALEAAQDTDHRRHLGASVIGKDCPRELWYLFRWALTRRHGARILRLFDRGHREEARFVEWLRAAGIAILDADPDTGEQFRISDVLGHFGGSLDGEVRNVPDVEDEHAIGVAEFKTHAEKSFNDLVAKGVRESKFVHFVQMQLYMHKRERAFALYVAVNKNTDALHAEIVPYDRAVAELYLGRAFDIIHALAPPARLPGASPGWFKCRICDFRSLCHGGDVPEINCRTCQFSTPVEGGEWLCGKFGANPPADFMARGCDEHVFIPSLIGHDIAPGVRDGTYYATLPTGARILVGGPGGVSSRQLVAAGNVKSPALATYDVGLPDDLHSLTTGEGFDSELPE